MTESHINLENCNQLNYLFKQRRWQQFCQKFLCVLTLFVSHIFVTQSLQAATTGTLDWDTVAWVDGTLSNAYAVANGNIDLTFTGGTGFFVCTTAAGGGTNTQPCGAGTTAHPKLLAFDTGGTGGELTLDLFVDFATNTDQIVLTMTFDHPGGVSDLSFSLFDVDESFATPYTDRIIVTATNGSTTFNPTLTTSLCNTLVNPTTVTGTGDCASSGDSTDGNVDILFTQSGITSVTILYDNIEAQAGAPGSQAITMHDITFISNIADLQITKTNSPSTVDVYTPGVPFTYELSVTNNGPDSADGATVSDDVLDWGLGVSWSCAPATGSITANCGVSSGSGDLASQVITTLPAGESVVYTVTGIYSTNMADYPQWN